MVLDVMRFSLIRDTDLCNISELVYGGSSEIVDQYVVTATDSSYRSFAVVEEQEDLLKDSLKFANYNRSIFSKNNEYNSWLTFLDNKLEYWGIKETVFYPKFLDSIVNRSDLAAMLGIKYVIDSGNRDFHSYEVDETTEKTFIFQESGPVLDKCTGYYSYIINTDEMEQNSTYLITIEANLQDIELIYADFCGNEYDGINSQFINKGNNTWEALVYAPENVKDTVVRIIEVSDDPLEIKNVKLEKVSVIDKLRLVEKTEEDIDVYEVNNTNKLIYIPQYVYGVDSYGESYKDDNFVDVNANDYVLGYDGGMDLSGSNSKVVSIEQHRNSVTAFVSADTNIFLNHSQLAYSGWRAYVDGESTKLYVVNNLIQGVEVPAGNHTVEFRYVPMDLYIGIGMTLSGYLAIAVWIIRENIENKKEKIQRVCEQQI